MSVSAFVGVEGEVWRRLTNKGRMHLIDYFANI